MADKRIEVVQTDANKANGNALVRVLDVKTKPTDVRFRIGYRYTNEWLGQDGYWRRSMTMIEPKDWRHENDVLELTIGPEVQSSIEPNQPIRIEVPGVDAGQVVLWPSALGDAPSDAGSSPTATEAAIASLAAEKAGGGGALTDATGAQDDRNGAASTDMTSDADVSDARRDANSETRAAQARAIATAKTIATGHGSPASRLRENPPLAPRRSAQPTEADLDNDMENLAPPTASDPLIATSVRGSNAIDRVDAPLQKRRSLTRRRRHPQRGVHAEPTTSADFGATPIPTKNAIVPAPHYNTSPEDFAHTSRRDGHPSPWRLPLAMLLGLGAGVGGYAAYQGAIPSASLDQVRLAEIERRLAQTEVAAPSAQSATTGADEARMAELVAETTSLRAQIADLTTQLNTRAGAPGASDQIEMLSSALQSLEAENAKLSSELETVAQNAAAVQADAATLNAAASDLAAERDAALARIQEIEQRAADAERNLDEQSANFLVERSTLATQLDDTRAALEAARLEIETATEARDAAEAVVEGAEIERNQAQAQAADLQFSIARLEAEITQLQTDRDAALAQIATLEQSSAAEVEAEASAAAREDLAAAQTALDGSRAEVAALTTALEELRRERNEATQRAAEASVQAGALASLQAERDDLLRDLETERAERADVERKLADAELEISDIQSAALDNAAGSNQRALTALNAAEIARAEAIEATETERQRADGLAQELEAMRVDLAAAQAAPSNDAEMAELKAALAETQRSKEIVEIEATAARAEIAALESRLAERSAIEPAITEAEASQLREAAARAERQHTQARAEIEALRRQIASLPAQTTPVATAATISSDPSRAEAAVDAAFSKAGDLLPTRSIQRSKLRMRLIKGEPVFGAVRGELGLRYARFDELVDSLCQSLPEQCG